MNALVELLLKYQPFGPSNDQLYSEKATDLLDFNTNALDYLKIVVKNSETRVIILTGDAGHGKTHLCRKIIEFHLGYNADEARDLINNKCDGYDLIEHKKNSEANPLIIFKDFSEPSLGNAIKLMESACNSETTTIICANEGRLRAVLESNEAGSASKMLLKHFKSSFDIGLASQDGKNHIINLNFQSVAGSKLGNNFIEAALIGQERVGWLDGRRWSKCAECGEKSNCHILRNRNLLTENVSEDKKKSRSRNRREKLSDIFATLERLKVVITIRDMLSVLAYIITGGSSCSDIKKKNRNKGKEGWQYKYAFYNLLFEPPDAKIKSKLHEMPILNDLALIDPGLRSFRNVDDDIVNSQSLFKPKQTDTTFKFSFSGNSKLIDAAEGIDQIIGNPRGSKERIDEANFTTSVLRSLRRRRFFDEDLTSSEKMKRLGFDNGGDFLTLIEGELSEGQAVIQKRKISAGIHMLQGLRMKSSVPDLHLVDPAFGSATTSAAIIARIIDSHNISIIPMREKWDIPKENANWSIVKSVDWLDRHVVLRIKDHEDKETDFELDLLMYNCITRASGGYIAQEFYSHEIRRIKNFLGRIAEKSDENKNIQLFMRGRLHKVSLDGNTIQVS